VKTLTQTYSPKQITADGSGAADSLTTASITGTPTQEYNALGGPVLKDPQPSAV